MAYNVQHLKALSDALLAQDIVKASFIFDGFYKHWPDLDAPLKSEVKNLEPVYLTLVHQRVR